MIAIINSLISVYLSKTHGGIGAAIGTSLSLVIGNIIVMNLYYHFKVKLNMIRFYKELVSGLLLSVIVSILIGSLLNLITINNWNTLIIQGFLFTIIYITVIWIRSEE